MKFLLLNQTFHPDTASTAQHLAELAAALIERGHEVTVVTGRRAYDNPENSFPARETWHSVRIHRVFSTGFGKRTKWRRAADFASFIVSCVCRLALLPRHDVVVALTTPPLISFIGAWRARLWRAGFCYWVMDFNPDEAVAAGWLRTESAAYRILDRMSRFSLQNAHRIIALDDFMRDRIAAKNVLPDKISVIPPWSHDGAVRFDPAGRSSFRAAHGLENKFVVMYSGNHSPVHPLDTLMQAADLLKSDASIVFCFIGGGSEFQRVRKWAAKGDRKNVLCLPYQPLEQLAASLSAAEAHVVVMGARFVGLVHPCKIYNILAVGAPVIYIGPNPSHVTRILDSLGETYPSIRAAHGEAELLANQLQQLRKSHYRPVASATVTDAFSQNRLLPQLIAALESARPE